MFFIQLFGLILLIHSGYSLIDCNRDFTILKNTILVQDIPTDVYWECLSGLLVLMIGFVFESTRFYDIVECDKLARM
jgi:type III secretory pathway component EscR